MNRKEFTNLLQDRTTTSFGISIGTGLLLESLFDPTTDRYDSERPIPPRVDLTKYNYYLINGYTLIRNIISSLQDRTAIASTEPKLVAELISNVLKQEIYILKGLLATTNLKDNYFKLIVPEYDYLIKNFNKGKDINIKYIQNTITAIKLFKPYLEAIDYTEVVKTKGYRLDKTITYNSLITTHLPIDLLQSNYMTLLESHTGVIKDNHLWYTKYHALGSLDLSILPMNDIVYFIMGDDHMVRGVDTKYKRELYNIALEKKWSYRTTRDKILMNISKSEGLQHILSLSGFKAY